MKGLIRSIVSLPKLPYENEKNIRYDLAYVTPRLIVSSGPVNSAFKKWYRYPIEDLVAVLNHNHGTKWHIWNLRGEGKGYTETDVEGRMSYYPFPDHQAPPFALMLAVVEDMDTFLSQDEENVALVHCKAGKGRSGTLCCAYMLYQQYKEGEAPSSSEVNAYYTSKRMRPGSVRGVSIRSQLRYLKYFERYLKLEPSIQESCQLYHSSASAVRVQFKELLIWDVASYVVSDNMKLQIELQCYEKNSRNGSKIYDVWSLDTDRDSVDIQDTNVKIPFSELQLQSSVDYRLCINGLLFAWFNVFFETANGTHVGHKRIQFEHFDGFKGSSQRGSRLFDRMSISWAVEWSTDHMTH